MGYSTRSRTRGNAAKSAQSAVSGATKVIKKAVATVSKVAKSRGKKAAAPAAAKDGKDEFFPKGISLKTEAGEVVNTTDLVADSAFVVFLYPKANTPGCTNQACGFRDGYAKILEAGYKIYGLSYDSPKSQSNWKRKHSLPYTLLCDVMGGDLIKALGAGKAPKGIKRSHFVVDKGGRIVHKSIQTTPKNSIAAATEFALEHPMTSTAEASTEMNEKDVEKKGGDQLDQAKDTDVDMKDAGDRDETEVPAKENSVKSEGNKYAVEKTIETAAVKERKGASRVQGKSAKKDSPDASAKSAGNDDPAVDPESKIGQSNAPKDVQMDDAPAVPKDEERQKKDAEGETHDESNAELELAAVADKPAKIVEASSLVEKESDAAANQNAGETSTVRASVDGQTGKGAKFDSAKANDKNATQKNGTADVTSEAEMAEGDQITKAKDESNDPTKGNGTADQKVNAAVEMQVEKVN